MFHNLSKAQDLADKVLVDKLSKTVDVATIFWKKLKDEFNKTFIGLRITITNNDITYIIKVIRSLENRGILLKKTTRKIIIKKNYFSIFICH